MSAFDSVDYKHSHFEFKELTPIRGEPTYETLEQILKQLKANASKVHSNLGGGAHGHLGSVISPTTYALIAPGTPFDRPIFPGTQAIIPPGTNQTNTRILRDQFQEDLRVYHEVLNVEKALKQQLVTALDPMYLEAVRDRTSNTLTITVYEVMQHLFDNYGDVTPEVFQARETIVKSSTYDPLTPIDTLFKEIEDLVDLSGRAHVPMTPAQAVSIGYIILWKTGVLKDSLKIWNQLPAPDKTWIRFKTEFRNAVKEWKQLRGPTVQDSMYQQNANLICDIKNELKSVIVEEITKHTANIASYNVPPVPPQSFHDPYANFSPSYSSDPTIHHQMDQMANAISEYKEIVPSLMHQVKQLQHVIKQLKQDARFSFSPPTNISSDASTASTSATSTSSSSNGKYVFQPPFNLYCHTHGLCAHNGYNCKEPAAGHKKEATYFNRMNGNTRNTNKAKKNNNN